MRTIRSQSRSCALATTTRYLRSSPFSSTQITSSSAPMWTRSTRPTRTRRRAQARSLQSRSARLPTSLPLCMLSRLPSPTRVHSGAREESRRSCVLLSLRQQRGSPPSSWGLRSRTISRRCLPAAVRWAQRCFLLLAPSARTSGGSWRSPFAASCASIPVRLERCARAHPSFLRACSLTRARAASFVSVTRCASSMRAASRWRAPSSTTRLSRPRDCLAGSRQTSRNASVIRDRRSSAIGATLCC
mmetsp:Transcript_35679/g.76178  ORF Transcript_35679/g.76178 Transcript_35679/m.76178 type:complete len:245 (+) Transcript_35679:445-1179(+)